jgi:ABC-type antimicrobial peptide transport system permease subunit
MGKGTPQLSKSTIQLVPLTVIIEGPGGRKAFKAKVVGFSERISSILVPDKFLSWANEFIGDADDTPDASRLIIKIKGDQSASFDEYIRTHGLKISDEKQKFNKILTVINVVMSILVFIGTAFMIFALVIVMLNFSLMVTQAKEEVSLLLQLGYTAKHLVWHLVRYLLIFMAAVTVLSVGVLVIGNYFLMTFFSNNGMDVSAGISVPVVLLGVIFIVVSYVVSYYAIRRVVSQQL